MMILQPGIVFHKQNINNNIQNRFQHISFNDLKAIWAHYNIGHDTSIGFNACTHAHWISVHGM